MVKRKLKGYYIQVYGDSGPVFQEVKGYRVVVPGFEEYDLFSHKSADWSGWRVSEGQTGLALTVHPEATRAEAVQTVIANLNKVGKEVLDRCIADSKHGIPNLSPRYIQED